MGCPVAALEVRRRFWRLIVAGASTAQAAAGVGVSRNQGQVWFRDSGGMPPMDLDEPSGRYLSLAEREEIALARAAGLAVRAIARSIRRSPSTVSRELRRNAPTGSTRPRLYRASLAQGRAEARAKRPKPGKLAVRPRLREVVQDMLDEHFSPEQISGRLPLLYPDDAQLRISHEAIYQSLYVHPRGLLRRDLTQRLRTGRALRKPRRRVDGRRSRGRISNMVMIADRPPEVQDRAVPGDWEGDLLVGANNKSAVGTLVDRKTRFTILLHLPDGYDADNVQIAITRAVSDLPQHLRRSLTWDQGVEMANHGAITMATDMAIYFCDPHSPWQRGTNENTNGLLRQYLPKGTDLAVHTADDLAAVMAQLNARPRKVLGFRTPAEVMAPLLQTGADIRPLDSVATTP
jgi:IS30 family transposase